MKSKPVALLRADLGVTKTHSRPYTSDDNPFSESHFKTMKYRPEFPESFGTIEDPPVPLPDLLPVVQPRSPPLGDRPHDPGRRRLRSHPGHHRGPLTALNAAFEASPARFKGRAPTPKLLPSAVWINPPNTVAADPQEPPEQHQIRQPGVSLSLTRSGSAGRPDRGPRPARHHCPQWVAHRPFADPWGRVSARHSLTRPTPASRVQRMIDRTLLLS